MAWPAIGIVCTPDNQLLAFYDGGVRTVRISCFLAETMRQEIPARVLPATRHNNSVDGAYYGEYITVENTWFFHRLRPAGKE
jgi:hypothetical protein